MENASLPSDVWHNFTSYSSKNDDVTLNLHLLKVISSIIAVIGTLDNLFVIIVFALFIKITDKVGLLVILQYDLTEEGRFRSNAVSLTQNFR